MGVIVQRTGFAPDRQFVDVTVELPDSRPGWSVMLQSKGPTSATTPRQPCATRNDANGGLRSAVRFYPFLMPGNYRLSARLIPPETEPPSRRQKPGAPTTFDLGRVTVPPLDEARAAEWLRHDGADLNQAASRALVPLCVDSHGTPCFWPVQGPSPRRIAVLSIPKAGTYMMTTLLANLGVVSCNVHIGRGLVGDYRSSRQMPPPFQRFLDVAYSSRLVLPGQSMASHMRRDLGTQVALHDFSKIFVYRELRAALVSAFRAGARRAAKKSPDEATDGPQAFIAWLERGDLERMRKQYEAASGWYTHSDVCRVSFEDMMGDAGPERQQQAVIAVAAQCGIEASEEDARGLLAKTIGTESQTFSGARSPIEEYWTPEAERLFSGAGLDRLNALLGYPPRQ